MATGSASSSPTRTSPTSARTLAAAASANARNKLYLTVDPADAIQLARPTLPELDDHNLSHFDWYTAVARLLVGGREHPGHHAHHPGPLPIIGETTAIRQAVAAAGPNSGVSALEEMASASLQKTEAREEERLRRHRRTDGHG